MLIHGLVLSVISYKYTCIPSLAFKQCATKSYMRSHCLVSLGISFFFSLSHTNTHTQKTFSPPDCFPIFLAARFMVRGMLETGYYHVLFELISQTKWSGGSGDIRRPLPRHTLLLHAATALACVNPAPAAASPCFSSALGSSAVLTQPIRFSPIRLEAGCWSTFCPCWESDVSSTN